MPDTNNSTRPRPKHPARAALVAALIVAALVAGTPTATAASGQQTRVFSLDPSYPNAGAQNIAYDRSTGTFYVSTFSFFGPTTGSGTIYSGSLASGTLTPFLTGGTDGRTQSKGLAVSNGLLYVTGAQTDQIWVYNLADKSLQADFATGAGGWSSSPRGSGGLLNQIIVTTRGDVFVTDSFRPILWHLTVAQVAAGCGTPNQTPGIACAVDQIPLSPELPYTCCTQSGYVNLNGLVANPAGDTLWAMQSSTGKLWRIHFPDLTNLQHRQIQEVPVQGGPFPAGEDLIVDSGYLLLTQNGLAGYPAAINVIELQNSGSSGELENVYTDRTFQGPSGIVRVGRWYLVVDTHFVCVDNCASVAVANPPWTVSGVPVSHVIDDQQG